jgi:hypothetical protein
MGSYLAGMGVGCCKASIILNTCMKNWMIYSVPVVGTLIFLVGWKLMYPWLGYMLDSDAVGYLTVAERIAKGEYFTSINSLWSPLNSWLLLVQRHDGMNLFYRAQVWNVIFGVILLWQTWLLMLYFKVDNFLLIVSQLVLSGIMVYFVYYQVFADLLQCVFVATYLLWVLYRQLKPSLVTALVAGLIIGIGFYGKAYTWFFLVFHFLTWQFWLYKFYHQSIKKSIANAVLCLMMSLFVMSPWIYAIRLKFGVWSLTGLSGKMNMSWYINSGKSFKDSIQLLIPPTYSNSPSFWEDPYWSQHILTGPFSSISAFFHWIARIFHTVLNAVSCYSELSIFALVLIGWGLYFFLITNKNKIEYQSEQFILLALIILPLGYLTMHVETRYLWLSIFLLPVIFNHFLRIFLKQHTKVFTIVWCFSFLVFPIMQIEQLRGKNKDLFDEANQWRAWQFKQERFTSSAQDEGRMWVISYLTQSMYYTIESPSFTENELISEMKRYNIKWYLQEKGKCTDGFYFNGNIQWKKSFETTRFVAYELIY